MAHTFPRVGVRGPHLPSRAAEIEVAPTLSFITTTGWPTHRTSLHTANPDLRVAWEMMPQFGTLATSQSGWDIRHAITERANEENWWLRRFSNGAQVKVWNKPVIDFTREGVALAVAGMISEWLGEGGNGSDLDVMVFDLLIERWWRGWLGDQANDLALRGGSHFAFEDFSRLWADGTAAFLDALNAPQPIITGGDSFGVDPLVYECVDGQKIEDALHRFTDWFAEYEGIEDRRRGLGYVDDRVGTDSTIFECQYWPGTDNESRARLAFATALLTDAIFMFNVLNTEGRDVEGVPNPHPILAECASFDLGAALGRPTIYGDRDVYVRTFERGVVAVYPKIPHSVITQHSFDRMRAFNDAWNAASISGKAALMEAVVNEHTDATIERILDDFASRGGGNPQIGGEK